MHRLFVTPQQWYSFLGVIAVLLLVAGVIPVSNVKAAEPHAGALRNAEQLLRHPHARSRKAEPEAHAPSITTRERPAFNDADENAASVPGIPEARFWADSVPDFNRAVPYRPDNWLVLSEGGEDGAFGAGVLAGWTRSGTRPSFSVVTGVSTGALMAPYAFLGPAYDDRLRELYLTITAADIFENGATNRSLLDTWPLAELINRNVDAQLLGKIAEEHRRGRRLFVVTTNLDAGRPVVWNMGAIAERGSEGLTLFRQVLLASASIPGMFPPVMIDVEANGRRIKEMHADGGTMVPFYVAPQKLLLGEVNDRLPAKQIRIVINGKLIPHFQETEASTIGVLGRSIELALQVMMRSDIAAVQAITRRDGVDLAVASVDPDFLHESHGAFDPDYMKALFARGLQQGSGTALSGERPLVPVLSTAAGKLPPPSQERKKP